MEEPSNGAQRWLPPMSYYAKVTVTVALTLAVLSAVRSVLNILVLILIAAVLAVGLDPAVRRLERLRIRRGLAVAVIFILAVGAVAAFLSLVVPPLVREVGQLADDIPGYLDRLKEDGGWLGDLTRRYDLADRLKALTERLPSLASSSFGTILGFTKSLASAVFNTLTIAVLTIYFLLSLPRIRGTAVALFAPDHRDRAQGVLDRALGRIGGYVSGIVTVSLVAGVAAYVAIRIIGIPFASALAMWVALSALIPSVGATLGAILVVAVGFFSSAGDALAAAIYFVTYQQIENYVISPRIMKGAVGLSPASVILSVLIGGSLAGFAGALLALPLAAALKVVLYDIWLEERLAAGSPDPSPEPESAPEAETV